MKTLQKIIQTSLNKNYKALPPIGQRASPALEPGRFWMEFFPCKARSRPSPTTCMLHGPSSELCDLLVHLVSNLWGGRHGKVSVKHIFIGSHHISIDGENCENYNQKVSSRCRSHQAFGNHCYWKTKHEDILDRPCSCEYGTPAPNEILIILVKFAAITMNMDAN